MRMKLLFLLFLLPLAVPVSAADESIEITEGYERGLPPGAVNTAAFMNIRNTGTEDVVLTGGATSVAESVSIHATENHDGMMHMVHQMSVTIPAGQEVVLASGGLHLMLMGLRQPLGNGPVDLTLEFGNGFVKTLELPVISVLDELNNQ